MHRSLPATRSGCNRAAAGRARVEGSRRRGALPLRAMPRNPPGRAGLTRLGPAGPEGGSMDAEARERIAVSERAREVLAEAIRADGKARYVRVRVGRG